MAKNVQQSPDLRMTVDSYKDLYELKSNYNLYMAI